MIFRGDGKSNLLNYDFFSPDFDHEFDILVKEIGSPTIGFINPPYSGSFTDYDELNKFRKKPNSKNKKPWMKEISFIEKMLKICKRYVVAIVPPQALMSEEELRNILLKNNTLKAVINMPGDLFEPNASTGSAIVVFETNRDHDYKKDVLFYNLTDDGYVLTKKKGRRDVFNKWNDIKKKLLKKLDAPFYRNPQNVNGIDFIKQKIEAGDEWVFQAHSKIDFSLMNQDNYIRALKEKVLFDNKKAFDLIAKDINTIDLIDIFMNIDAAPANNNSLSLKGKEYKLFDINYIFDIKHGERITKKDRNPGDYPLITAGKYDNGIKEFIDNDAKKQVYSDAFHFDMFGDVFYNDFEFLCDDNIYPLIIKDEHKENFDKYNTIFVLAVLKHMTKNKFDYTRQLRGKRIDKDINIKISLPVIEDEIDWEFMSEYIKTLSYSKAI
jgi:hypothetical protein